MKTINESTHVRVIDLTGLGVLSRDQVVAAAARTQKDPRPGDRIVFLIDPKAKADLIVPGEVEAAQPPAAPELTLPAGMTAYPIGDVIVPYDDDGLPVNVHLNMSAEGILSVTSLVVPQRDYLGDSDESEPLDPATEEEIAAAAGANDDLNPDLGELNGDETPAEPMPADPADMGDVRNYPPGEPVDPTTTAPTDVQPDPMPAEETATHTAREQGEPQ
jgi:hypothetical protein